MPQDKKLVSLRQKYEVYYLAYKYGIDVKYVREAIAAVGRSRKKIMAWLNENEHMPPVEIQDEKKP